MSRTLSTTVSRLLAGAASAALLAGSLSAIDPAHASSASAGRSVPQCSNADLAASYHRGNGAAGTIYGAIVLRNTSGHACVTGGYAGISYVGDGNGTQIGAPAVRIDASEVAAYVLAPGQRLRAPIGETEALNYPKGRCHPAHVDGFRVYVPNSFASQYVAHPTTGCRNAAIKLIHEKPLRRP
jgi:hypothetical protein